MIVGFQGVWGFSFERWFKGEIDDIGIWNRALSAQEIASLYNAQSTTNCTLGAIQIGDTTVCAGSTVTLNAVATPSPTTSCFAPLVRVNGNQNFNITSVTTDPQGNIYHSGSYAGNVTIGSTSLSGIGGRDFFLVKYDSCGNQQWAIRGGSSANEDYAGGDFGKGLATDATGNIYMVGRYNQTCTIYGADGTTFTAPYTVVGSNVNHQDGFLVKISPAGTILWGATLRGGSNDGINGVTVDPSGNPIITAGFNGCCPSSFAGTIFGTTNSLNISSFGSNYGTGAIVKFNSAGAVQWAARIYNRDASAGAVKTDASGNIYVTSNFRSWSNGSSAQVYDGLNSVSSIFNPGIGLGYLLKLAPNGALQWGTTFGNNGDGVNPLAMGTGIDIDTNGYVWVCGYYSGAATTFYSVTGASLTGPASTGNRGFLVKYSPSGQALSVATHQQTSNSSTLFTAVACNGNEIRAVGSYSGANLGSNDLLIANYNLAAVQQSVQTSGGPGDDAFYDIRKYKAGYLMSGSAGSGASVGGNTLSGDGSFIWNTIGGTSPAPNPTYLWSTGATTASINVTPAQTGTYYVTISDGMSSCTDSVKVMVNNISNSIFNNDTISTCGQSYSLQAAGGFSSYSWSTGATAQTVTVSANGWYLCTASNGNCQTVDSVFLNLLNAQILNNDTSICPGAQMQLMANGNCGELGSGSPQWQLLIPGSNIPSNGFNVKPFSYDRINRIWYSAYSDGGVTRFQKFDLNSNTVTQLPANGWPGTLVEFCFDPTNNRIVGGRSGRDIVYSIPVSGGTWTQIGNGSFDSESYGGMFFWNHNTSRTAFFGGYGFFAVKNWIWENSGGGWINTRQNLSDCQPAKRGGNSLQAANGDYTKYYLFSGQGSCDGNQFASSCALGSPWQTDVGQYCWLRDLWELDISTYQFTNILPANNQTIVREGSLVYDYTQNTFYTIGGYIPTGNYGVYGPATMDVFRMRRNIDNGFTPLQVNGTVPTPTNYAYSIFDATGNRIVYARQDGIWALNLGSSCNLSYLWSNGATTASINVSPTQTTTYYVTVSNGNGSCMDSVIITVNNIPNEIFTSDTISFCGSSYELQASGGLSSYTWNTGATTQSIIVNNRGWYKCTAGVTGCSNDDSVFVDLFSVTIDQNDTTICLGSGLYLSVNTTSELKLSHNWSRIFSSAYGGYGRSIVDNDSIVISGATWPSYPSGTTDQLVTKVSLDGTLGWQAVRAPGWDHDGFSGVQKMSNGNYLFFGQQNAQGTQYFDGFWTIYSRNGIEQSYGFFSIPGSTSGSDVKRLPDNKYVFTGPYGNNNQYVTLTDSNLVSLATLTFPVGSWTGSSIEIDNENNLIYVLGSYSGVNYFKLLQIDFNFNLLNTFTVNRPGNTLMYDLTIRDGNVLVAGSETISGSRYGRIFEINSIGSIVSTISELIPSEFTAITKTPVGYVAAKSFLNGLNATVNTLVYFNNSGQRTDSIQFNNSPFVPYDLVYSNNSIIVTGAQGPSHWIGTPRVDRISLNPYNINYLWSTGATTASINVTPTQTTTYYVTVNNGTSSCSDSVTVTVIPGSTAYYADMDNDGYGDSLLGSFCQAPPGALALGGDCNDSNPAVYPGATEVCNGLDDDCDGLADDGLAPVVGAISGSYSQCIPVGAGSAIFSIPPVQGAAAYQWLVPAGLAISAGANSNSVTVAWTAPSSHSGISGPLSVTVTGVCGQQSTTRTVDLSLQISPPVRPPTISGPIRVCPGDTALYSIAQVTRSIGYTWTLPAGMTLVDGQGTNIIRVFVTPAFLGGNVGVSAYNACGAGPVRTKSIGYNVPATPTAIIGTGSGLCGLQDVPYSIVPVTGISQYQWTVPSGVQVNGSSNGTSILLDFSTTFTGGTLSVVSVNGCGQSMTRSLALTAIPARPGSVSGPSQLCPGTTAAYGVGTVTGATTYTWTIPTSATGLNGQGTKNISFTAPITSSSGNSVSVVASNSCGGSQPRTLSGINVDAAFCGRLASSGPSNLEAYPNPTLGWLNLKAEGMKPRQIEVYNMLGECVINTTWKTELDMRDLPAGMYVLKVRDVEGGNLYRRIEVQR